MSINENENENENKNEKNKKHHTMHRLINMENI